MTNATDDNEPHAAALSGEEAGVRYAFFTRTGGVSRGIYESLNCGAGSKDDPEHVGANRAIVAGRMGVPAENLVTVYQCHTASAVIANGPWPRNDAPVADAIVTARPGLALAVLTADCAPVLLADTGARVAGAAHAGWRGAAGGVVEAAIVAMESLGARRSRIRALVGPTISVDAYEVGDDFREAVLQADPAATAFFAQAAGRPRLHFDLPGFVMSRLKRAGVGTATNLGMCTYSRESMFFSYRRAQRRKEADYGRQISAILIL